jgi:hypothetical protein
MSFGSSGGCGGAGHIATAFGSRCCIVVVVVVVVAVAVAVVANDVVSG